MKVAAYQFAVSADVGRNMEIIAGAVREAQARGVELLTFPECALTGYPPRDMASSQEVDFDLVRTCKKSLQALSDETGVAFVVGLIDRDPDQGGDEGKDEKNAGTAHGSDGLGRIVNRAVFFAPGEAPQAYDKRALWGWDRDNFTPGTRPGVFEYKGFRIGVRICFEVRFPEYFRELYRAQTDLDIVLLYDVTDTEDAARYDMIRAHLQTRAVENVCPVLSVDTISPYQTAPTMLFGRSGQALAECGRGKAGFIEYDLLKEELNFGEQGRKEISDLLAGAGLDGSMS